MESRARAPPGCASLGPGVPAYVSAARVQGAPAAHWGGGRGEGVPALFLGCAIYCTAFATYLYLDRFSFRGISCADTLCFIGLFL